MCVKRRVRGVSILAPGAAVECAALCNDTAALWRKDIRENRQTITAACDLSISDGECVVAHGALLVGFPGLDLVTWPGQQKKKNNDEIDYCYIYGQRGDR